MVVGLVAAGAYFIGKSAGEKKAHQAQAIATNAAIAAQNANTTSNQATTAAAAAAPASVPSLKTLLETDCEFCLDMREKLHLTGIMGGRKTQKDAPRAAYQGTAETPSESEAAAPDRL